MKTNKTQRIFKYFQFPFTLFTIFIRMILLSRTAKIRKIKFCFIKTKKTRKNQLKIGLRLQTESKSVLRSLQLTINILLKVCERIEQSSWDFLVH